jgi:hypothetical protein
MFAAAMDFFVLSILLFWVLPDFLIVSFTPKSANNSAL